MSPEAMFPITFNDPDILVGPNLWEFTAEDVVFNSISVCGSLVPIPIFPDEDT